MIHFLAAGLAAATGLAAAGLAAAGFFPLAAAGLAAVLPDLADLTLDLNLPASNLIKTFL